MAEKHTLALQMAAHQQRLRDQCQLEWKQQRSDDRQWQDELAARSRQIRRACRRSDLRNVRRVYRWPRLHLCLLARLTVLLVGRSMGAAAPLVLQPVLRPLHPRRTAPLALRVRRVLFCYPEQRRYCPRRHKCTRLLQRTCHWHASFLRQPPTKPPPAGFHLVGPPTEGPDLKLGLLLPLEGLAVRGK